MNIPSAASPIAPIAPIAPAAAPSSSAGAGFSAALGDAMARVDQYHARAGETVQRFLAGEDEELHRVAMATQQAELSLDLFLQMKNKVVQAYQEIMRMQI